MRCAKCARTALDKKDRMSMCKQVADTTHNGFYFKLWKSLYALTYSWWDLAKAHPRHPNEAEAAFTLVEGRVHIVNHSIDDQLFHVGPHILDDLVDPLCSLEVREEHPRGKVFGTGKNFGVAT